MPSSPAARTAETALESARVFPGGEPEVAREAAARREALDITDEGHESGRDQEADSRDEPQQLHGRGLLRDTFDRSLRHLDTFAQGLDFLASGGQDRPQGFGDPESASPIKAFTPRRVLM